MAKRAQQIIPVELVIVPDQFTPNFQLMVRRDQKAGITGLYYTEDAGKTWTPMVPAPTSKDKAGSVLTLAEDLSGKWMSPRVVAQSIAIASGIQTPIQMVLVGALETAQTFGYFKVSSGLSYTLKEIQLSLQTTADLEVQIDVINGSGVPQGQVAKIQPGSRQSATVFTSTPLVMPANTIWSLKILQSGSFTAPGENLSARLILVPTQL